MADRKDLFLAFHSLAHPGIRATRRLMSSWVVWPHMAADIAACCRECQQCQRANVTKQASSAVSLIPVPAKRFTHLSWSGPLPSCPDGHKYLMTMVDQSSRWLEAAPLKDMEAYSCVTALLQHWIACFGVPAAITTDRGRQLTSAAFCKGVGAEHITTKAYHLQSNGMVERSHRQLKDTLRARLADHDWPSHLPWVLLGLRAAPKKDSGVSFTKLVFGAPLTLPGEFVSAAELPVQDFFQRLRQAHLLHP